MLTNKKEKEHKKKKSSEEVTLIYQSPIALCCQYIKISQNISVEGRIKDAKYNPETQRYEVRNPVILTVGSTRYQLQQYHFHVPGEHQICGKIYESELHYIFIELYNDETCISRVSSKDNSNVCNCTAPVEGRSTVGIGRVINGGGKIRKLNNLKVLLPDEFYEYDGTRTIVNGDPIRWIIGKKPLRFDIDQLIPIAQTALPLQPLDGRIILFNGGCSC